MGKRRENFFLTFIAFSLCLSGELSWGKKEISQVTASEADKLADSIIDSVESDQSVQSSSYNSLHQSAVDNLMNSQKGQATAQILSSSLAVAADSQSQTCDKDSDSGKVACATAGALLGMATLTQESAGSFDGPIMTAWSNVCHFSVKGCADEPPNPFTSGAPQNSGFTYGKIDSVTKKLELEGYILNNKNGTIATPDGRTLDPNKRKSIQKALGEERTSQLMNKVRAFEADALRRISRVPLKKYLSSLGLNGAAKNFKWGQKNFEPSTPTTVVLKAQGKSPSSTQVQRVESGSTLFRNVDGVPLGVASENIFKMIQRRYRMKEQQGSFFKQPL